MRRRRYHSPLNLAAESKAREIRKVREAAEWPGENDCLEFPGVSYWRVRQRALSRAVGGA